MDLNLFAVFEAIMRHGSVSQAAQSLGLTQPAASNALTRLRGQLGDQLFVRSKNGMLPTRFATQMAPVIARALSGLAEVASQSASPSIALADLKRNFTFVMSDLEEALFITELIGGLAKAAPGISVEVRPFRSDILQDALELERVDFVMAHLEPSIRNLKNLVTRNIATLDFVCVMARAQALADRPVIQLEEYLERGHILVAPDRRGRRGVIDAHLRTMGRQRAVVCSIPHFLSACLLVSETDHLVTLPRQLAERAARHFPLRIMELPIPVEGFSIGLHWRSTRDKDPEHASLRDFILATLSPD